MKGKLKFDVATLSLGAATEGIRTILTEYEAIDWYRAHGDAARASSSFDEHFRVFESVPKSRVQIGSWDDFRALRQRAYDDAGKNWDWKYSGLKDLTKKHSERCGYSLEEAAPKLGEGRLPSANDLFFALPNSVVIWGNINLELAPEAFPAKVPRESIHWYIGYATQDISLAIEWQLAERSSDLTTNPFVPLFGCLAEGFYPFVFQPDDIVLFGFTS